MAKAKKKKSAKRKASKKKVAKKKVGKKKVAKKKASKKQAKPVRAAPSKKRVGKKKVAKKKVAKKKAKPVRAAPSKKKATRSKASKKAVEGPSKNEALDVEPGADGEQESAWHALEDGETVELEGRAYNLSVVDAGELVLPEGRLVACDPFAAMRSRNNPYLTVPPGRYPVKVTAATLVGDPDSWTGAYASLLLDSEREVERLHLAMDLDGGRSCEGAAPWGFPVDAGTACFVDDGALASGMPEDEEAWYDEIFDHEGADSWFRRMDDPSHIADGIANVPLPRAGDGSNLVLFQSGDGDGVYPVIGGYSADGRLVAVHIDFGVVTAGPVEEAEVSERTRERREQRRAFLRVFVQRFNRGRREGFEDLKDLLSDEVQFVAADGALVAQGPDEVTGALDKTLPGGELEFTAFGGPDDPESDMEVAVLPRVSQRLGRIRVTYPEERVTRIVVVRAFQDATPLELPVARPPAEAERDGELVAALAALEGLRPLQVIFLEDLQRILNAGGGLTHGQRTKAETILASRQQG